MNYARLILAAVILTGCSGRDHKDKPDPPRPKQAPPQKAVVIKKLILHPHPGQSPTATPFFIRANITFLQSQPFDGMSVYLRDGQSMLLGQEIQKPVAVPIETIRRVLAPMIGLSGKYFATVFGSSPPSFFDDAGWAIVVENWKRLAIVCKEVGLVGILFDNEQYASPWGNWISGGSNNLIDTQEKAIIRGTEVMTAVVAEYPAITVITLHGPSISRMDALPPIFPQWQTSNELLGPFMEGFLAGSGGTATIVDGGELYSLRSLAQFAEANVYRSANWPAASLGFGIYDKPFQGAAMNVSILRPTLVNAIAEATEWCWYYPELFTYLKSSATGGAPADWVQAIRNARTDAGM